MRTERVVVAGILAIVLVTALYIVAAPTLSTGQLAQNAYVGSKVYGGGAERYQSVMAKQRAADQRYIMKAQEFLYNHQDEWKCGFGTEALRTPYPCVFDAESESYCCVNKVVPRYG